MKILSSQVVKQMVLQVQSRQLEILFHAPDIQSEEIGLLDLKKGQLHVGATANPSRSVYLALGRFWVYVNTGFENPALLESDLMARICGAFGRWVIDHNAEISAIICGGPSMSCTLHSQRGGYYDL